MGTVLTEQEALKAIIKPVKGGYARNDMKGAGLVMFNTAVFAAMGGGSYEQIDIEPGFAQALLTMSQSDNVVKNTMRVPHVWHKGGE